MKHAPEIVNEVFDIIECPYPLRNELRCKSRNIRTVRYAIEADAFFGSRIWSYMPSELEESTLLDEFRSKIKTTACKLCKIYLQIIGYLQVTNWYMHIDTVICVSLFVSLFVLLGVFFCLFLSLFCFFAFFLLFH